VLVFAVGEKPSSNDEDQLQAYIYKTLGPGFDLRQQPTAASQGPNVPLNKPSQTHQVMVQFFMYNVARIK